MSCWARSLPSLLGVGHRAQLPSTMAFSAVLPLYPPCLLPWGPGTWAGAEEAPSSVATSLPAWGCPTVCWRAWGCVGRLSTRSGWAAPTTCPAARGWQLSLALPAAELWWSRSTNL